MVKKSSDAEDELAQLQVPAHPLPGARLVAASCTPSDTVMASDSSGGAAQAAKVGKLRERIKPYPVAGSRPGHGGVLADIERRRAREVRRTLRVAEAAKRRQQNRIIAMALALIAALGVGLLIFSRFV
ncbi:hypothetical protein LDHU3_36.5590:CDS1 [Leishmania donovani]|uniref:Hypothetical_protein n=1 Tax=Leishmania donovani TaxID=5661 RepID=A0A3Q8IRE6_LEIDO|nr:hypothetical protein LdCL_360048700 [Leishmania donovani]TPP42044.1 hypothetical protein CGC20_27930 [Leishmania donovani]TPP48522.1 hypothetical protein CGC21_14360 [Leishmania donovani]CAJ1993790.1 hypothetical protein LDHU3_36.5590:CDS1 [Leishmania donovani]VDZ49611.1 hypothetical_protein [Leishmania donovani]